MNPNTHYYQDSHQVRCTSTVVSCVPEADLWAVTLDNTVFYPEGGGQAADHGTLGDVKVLHVKEAGDTIVHLCTGALPVGSTVEGTIDWNRRFDLMQQHSGEHIVSGIIHSRYGFHNVGFHMGAETVTIDFDGMIPQEDLPELERLANEAVWKNLPVRSWFASQQEQLSLPYRTKKKLEGVVRLVEFPGYDLCACCGTHVRSTGEIGQIKILSWARFHQGVRMEMVCGGRALAYFAALCEQNRQVSNVFSAKPLETGAAARKFQEDFDAMKFRLTGLENRLFELDAQSFRDAGDVVVFREDLSPDSLRRLADKIGSLCGGRCILLSGDDAGGYRYAICHQGGDLRSFTKEWNTALQGRGGGKPNFVQGSVQATEARIRAFLSV